MGDEAKGGDAAGLGLAARLGARVRSLKDKLRDAEKRIGDFEAEKADLARKLTDATAKAGTSDEKDQRIAALESEMRRCALPEPLGVDEAEGLCACFPIDYPEDEVRVEPV